MREESNVKANKLSWGRWGGQNDGDGFEVSLF